ncbi:glycerophosphodiester phosphodiesterase [Kribbella deserti]|uniref:Glycerophosphodiester phosphodiesterase n=1 Tax=Kribbella deserti TaxID=1926257 RepID=A0ABV6QUL8_9ACTN
MTSPITSRRRPVRAATAFLVTTAAVTTLLAASPAATASATGTASPTAPAEATAPAAAAATAPTVSETFDGPGLPAGWTAAEGTWRVENGRLIGTSTSSSQLSRITFGTPLTDFRIEARLRFESAVDAARWTAFGLDLAPSGVVPWSIATLRNNATASNGLEFAQRTTANAWNVTNTAPSPVQVGTGKEVRVAVEVRGTRGVWYVDGREALRTTQVQRTPQGVQALLVNGSTVSFDDLTVTPLARESFVRKPGETLRIWAHRGASSAVPENTAASDEVARRAGAEWIENDVQPSKDGVPVILHDTTVDRTTDGSGAVRNLTAAQLAGLDAGSWFAPAFVGQRIPTLASQLEGLKTRGGNLLLEVKGSHTKAQVERIVAEIRAKGMSSRVFVQSFEPQHLVWMRELAPELPLGLLRSTLDADPVAIAKDLGLSAYNPSETAFRTKPGIVAGLHAAGVAVNVWTVDNATSWKFLEEADVDGIITNRPAELAGWNAAFKQRPAATVLSPAPGAKLDRAQTVTIAVDAADGQEITFDGKPVANGQTIALAYETAGRHVIKVGGVESSFEVIATRTGLAHLILTSEAPAHAVATMTSMLGSGRYDALATYAATPATRGIAADQRRLIIAEAKALRDR